MHIKNLPHKIHHECTLQKDFSYTIEDEVFILYELFLYPLAESSGLCDFSIFWLAKTFLWISFFQLDQTVGSRHSRPPTTRVSIISNPFVFIVFVATFSIVGLSH